MGRRHDYSVALEAIAAPTLVVHGGDDLQSIEVANDYAGWIPDSRVVTIQGAGLVVPARDPSALADATSQIIGGTWRGHAAAAAAFARAPDRVAGQIVEMYEDVIRRCA